MPDLQEIPKLIARIQTAVDCADEKSFAACWSTNATLNLQFEDGIKMCIEGRDKIIGLAAQGWKDGGSPLRHIVGSIVVTALGPEQARARSYALYLVPGQRPAEVGSGYYDDNLIVENGNWCIAERQHNFLNPIQLGASE